ncbi:molybdate ABC transporter substrate-binding protein [Sandarakinorhabdus sp.]|uniref:molybdate ABC transporter substrate-binding protein n=1 Tax=Sandarakinorhabdus sp. TaxID=1916663 RepID=UPI0033423274
MILRLLLLMMLVWPLAVRGTTVAAAADLRTVLPALAQAHEAATGQRITMVFGSSGTLAQQAMGGAPFDLLLMADAATAQRVVQALPGATARPYALGRLALVVRPGTGIRDLAGLQAALRSGRVRHLAIANPAHAPYGRAAQAVLASLGATAAAAPRLVLADNVAQALAYVTSGAAQAGLVALPLAQAGRTRGLIVLPVPPASHPPLLQTLVLMPGADAGARGFADRITSPAGRAVLAAAGFGLP